MPGASRIVLVTGPPGVGKTTSLLAVARSLDAVDRFAVREYGYRLAAAGHPLGLRTVGVLRRYEMLTDRDVNSYFRHFLAALDPAKRAVAVEGYPKTLPQCEDLTATLREFSSGISAYVVVDAPDDVLRQRVASRRICPACGLPATPEDGACADCRVPGVPRADDTAADHSRRLQRYRQMVEPMRRYFADRGLLESIDGRAPQRVVTSQLGEILARACGSSSVSPAAQSRATGTAP